MSRSFLCDFFFRWRKEGIFFKIFLVFIEINFEINFGIFFGINYFNKFKAFTSSIEEISFLYWLNTFEWLKDKEKKIILKKTIFVFCSNQVVWNQVVPIILNGNLKKYIFYSKHICFIKSDFISSNQTNGFSLESLKSSTKLIFSIDTQQRLLNVFFSINGKKRKMVIFR